MGQGQSAEAQLRSKAPPTNPIAINSADLRRTSGGSSLSPASLDPSSGLLPNTGIEGHVPHMICKPSSLLFQFFGVLSNFSALSIPPPPDPPGSARAFGVPIQESSRDKVYLVLSQIMIDILFHMQTIKRLTCATKLN